MKSIQFKKIAPYVFISSFFILFSIFFAWPVFYALCLSFTNWRGIGAPEFVGWANYIQLIFKDNVFHTSIYNTVYYIVGEAILSWPLALFLAVILVRPDIKTTGIFRTIYFLPVVTSLVVAAIMFKILYNFHYGIINFFLQTIGLPRLNWLGSRQWSRPAIVGLVVWRWTGYTLVYFMAGLQGISLEVYEAAKIDGANRIQEFFHITLPLLKPMILFIVIISAIGGWQMFAEVYVLTGGGPGYSTISMAMCLYKSGFQYLKLGYASAVGFILFMLVLSFSVLQMKIFGGFKAK